VTDALSSVESRNLSVPTIKLEFTMTLDAPALAEKVDTFFASAERNRQRSSTSGAAAADFGVIALLKEQSRRMPEEDYEQVATAIGQDARLKPFQSEIAMEMLGTVAKLRHHRHETRNDLIEDARNGNAFDPVIRAGLRYALDNFDKFREEDLKDGPRLPETPDHIYEEVANSPAITKSDIDCAAAGFKGYLSTDLTISASSLLLREFDNIDTSKNGVITASESKAWMAKHQPEKARPEEAKILEEAGRLLPQDSYRMFADPRGLTRELLATRIDQLKRQREKYENYWDMK
jgi:hypothetical protein